MLIHELASGPCGVEKFQNASKTFFLPKKSNLKRSFFLSRTIVSDCVYLDAMGGVPIAARKGGPLARNGRQASLLIGAGGQRRDPSRHVVFWRTRYLGVQSVARTLFSFKRPSLVRVCMFALPRFNDLGKFCFVASSIALKDGALSNGTASLRHSFLFFLPLLCFSRFVF